jgi:hypothetical protein
MADKQARADVAHIRQTTQFTCCAASIAAALKAHGKNVSEDDVNKVLGAAPMAGATWEAMLATVQYFGLRGSLIVPSTPRMLKAWTDQGLPVLIAWNPENRPWSHASVVFDVVEGADGVLQVHVMDPNIPNPSRFVRVLNEDEFCQKWGEKVSDSLIVRRPAMVVEREVTVEGRQVKASTRTAATLDWDWKPWAKVVVDWFEENLGDRPQVAVQLITKDAAKPYYYVSFILPAGPGSSSAFKKWMNDNKVLRRWRSFKNKWSKWGLVSNGTGDSEYHLPDGTFVQIMGLGFGSSSGAVKIAERYLRQKEAEAHDCYKDYKAGGLSWAEYQDCLKRFKDEEDDAWARSRPRVPTKPVPPDFNKRALRLLMALWFTTDKGKKFVKDNLYKSELSDKQWSWFESLERKYSRIIADMPDNPPLAFTTAGGMEVHMDRLSPADRARVEKHFYLDERRGRGRDWEVRPKSEAPVAVAPAVEEPVSAPSIRTTFESTRQTQMLAVLDTLISRTNSGMLKGFKRDLETGKGLTEDQMKAIRHNLYKSGMRPEADLFRVASLREAGVEKVRWVPLSGGGVKFVDEEVMVFISPKDAYEEFRDPNIPSWNDLTNDGEMFADGIPELMESGARLERDLKKWQQQGWWPNRRKVQHWLLTIMHRPTKKGFEAEFETLREAQTKAEQAIPSVRLRRRPSWLQISKEAGDREVDRLGALRAFWLFNSSRQRVYGILDSSAEGEPEVGMIVWDRKSDTWKVEQWLDTDQNYKRSLGSFTASDAREGVKRALMTFQDQRVKLGSQEESPVSKSAKSTTPVTEKKDPNKIKVEGPARRNPVVQQMIERGPGGAGKHHNRERDVEKGKSRKDKHKKDWREKEAASRVADRFLAEQE